MSDLPHGWVTISIGDLGEWRGGGTPSKSNEAFWDGDIPWVSPKDMKRRFISDAEDKITEAAVSSSATNLIPAGSVLIVTRSGILRHSLPTAVTVRPVAINQDLKALSPAPFVDVEFVDLQLRCETRQILSSCAKSGTTVDSVDFEALRRFPFCLPPLAEQRRIVEKLDALTARTARARADLDRSLDLGPRYRLSLLRAAMRGRLTEVWRAEQSELETVAALLKRTPPVVQGRGGREATSERIDGQGALAVNQPDRPLPAGWAWTSLLRITRQETGHTPSRSHDEYWDGGIPWIGIRDAGAHHGRVIESTMQTITKLGLENSSARMLPKGTVCLSRTASVGYVTMMGRDMATSQDFATWTCSQALEPRFLMYALMAEGDDIRAFGKGSTHTTIYFPEIRALHIALPPLAEQREIVRRIEAGLANVDRLTAEAASGRRLLDRLDQAILAKAFRGELVPQDPADEPASELLARIKADRQDAPKARRGRKPKAA